MTNILIVQGHPDPCKTHLCHAIAKAYANAAQVKGHRCQILHIADAEIPFLRSKDEWEGTDFPQVAIDGQAAVAAADHLVMIYPLWMGDVPAILKAWIEQVLRHGFAFKNVKNAWTPALKGKSARVIVTMGMPSLAYRWFFFAHSVRSLTRNILKFCGIAPVRWTICGNAEDPSGRTQTKILDRAARLGASAR